MKDFNGQNTMNAMSLLSTLEVDGRKQSTESLTKECLLEHHKLHSSQIVGSCLDNSIKASSSGIKSLLKLFSSSHNRFAFQKPGSVTSLVRSDVVLKDFKNPFKKMDSSLTDKSVLQMTGRTSVSETVKSSTSMKFPLSVEEEEELVDDPDSFDSGLKLGSVTSQCQPATSLSQW
jgi:hypothetical protein